jgi:MFS superfamily sulfate permease-like transporter
MDSLKADLLAGLTVALVLIPQSLAYAELAGLPPYYGLYASFLPPLVASLFGSSRQLATGPVAVVSLLTSTTLEPLATAGSQEYIAYAILLALLVGIFQFTLGVLKLGLVVNFISHPVVNGFTNAAALIIASSQLSKILGVYADKAPHHYETIFRVLKAAWHYIHWPTLFMATLAFVIMYGLKRLAPRIPNVIVAVVITTVLAWAFGFEHTSIADISTLNSTEMNPAITGFNRAVNSIALLSQKRSGLIKDLSNSGQTRDALKMLDTKYALERVNAQIQQFKDEAAIYREELRSFLFESVRQSAGCDPSFKNDRRR